MPHSKSYPAKPATRSRPRQAKRRTRGTGSIFWSERLRLWVGRVVIGRTLAGKTRYTERRHRDQAELVKLLAELRKPGPDVTVAAWAKRWLGNLTVRGSTLADYTHTINFFVVPTLGSLRLAELTAGDVEAAAKVWSARLSPNTLRKNLSHLSAMLAAAVRARLLAHNPVSLALKPRPKKPAIDPFTPAELRRIIAAAATPGEALFALLAASGCRVGEALALDSSDLDAAAGLVRIRRTYCPEHGYREPKSVHSVRTIRVAAAALPVLKVAQSLHPSGPLFRTRDDDTLPRTYDAAEKHWRRFLARLGIPFRNLHQLRHAVATLMISRGMPPGDVARHLGDTVHTVVRTYLHPVGCDPVKALDDVLGDCKVGRARGESRRRPGKVGKSA